MADANGLTIIDPSGTLTPLSRDIINSPVDLLALCTDGSILVVDDLSRTVTILSSNGHVEFAGVDQIQWALCGNRFVVLGTDDQRLVIDREPESDPFAAQVVREDLDGTRWAWYVPDESALRIGPDGETTLVDILTGIESPAPRNAGDTTTDSARIDGSEIIYINDDGNFSSTTFDDPTGILGVGQGQADSLVAASPGQVRVVQLIVPPGGALPGTTLPLVDDGLTTSALQADDRGGFNPAWLLVLGALLITLAVWRWRRARTDVADPPSGPPQGNTGS